MSKEFIAQEKNFFLHGMLRDSINIIKDVHVVNLNIDKGTFSNDYGQYRIIARLGDTLEFTSIQYKTITKVITDRIVYSKKMNVILIKKNYVLDEIILKNHDLTGELYSDRRKVPIDSIAGISRDMNDLILELSEKSNQNNSNNRNTQQKGLSKISAKNTDPTKSFKGIGSIINLGSRNKKKERIKRITSDTFSTKNILKDIGKYFFEELKISENNIPIFIDYCKQFNIKKLYEQEKILQLIKLLEDKSKMFLMELKEK
tara:strand:+ start:58691 stop:59467 length:777 start_codon:yes stop_codon:yes gene_type:complete